jgi:hypothetical protein
MVNGHPAPTKKPAQRRPLRRRSYSPSVEKALFTLSRGRCYKPSCTHPVVRMIDGDPIVDVHIAHICAHGEDGPRRNPSMSEEECKGFGNLILLCSAHHKVVDRKSNEELYPVELLRHWKAEREGELTSQLAGLDNLTEEKLQTIVAGAISDTQLELNAAIDMLSEVSDSAAAVLRAFKAESFDRPYLDLDAVASLAESARLLQNLEDNALHLHTATSGLQHLEANAYALQFATKRLGNLEANALALQSATQGLSKLEYYATSIDEAGEHLASKTDDAVRSINRATENLEETIRALPTEPGSPDYAAALDLSRNPVTSRDDPDRLDYLKKGFIGGVAATLVLAIIITILIAVHKGH